MFGLTLFPLFFPRGDEVSLTSASTDENILGYYYYTLLSSVGQRYPEEKVMFVHYNNARVV
jgi:hypothetical protein